MLPPWPILRMPKKPSMKNWAAFSLSLMIRCGLSSSHILMIRLAARRSSDSNKPSKSCSRGLGRWKTTGGIRLRKIFSLLLTWRTLGLSMQTCVVSTGPKPLAQFQYLSSDKSVLLTDKSDVLARRAEPFSELLNISNFWRGSCHNTPAASESWTGC